MSHLRKEAGRAFRRVTFGLLFAGLLLAGCGQDDGLGAQGQTEADLFITQPMPTILSATPSADPVLNVELQFSGISADAEEIIVYRVKTGSGIACEDGERVSILGVNYGNWFDTTVDWDTGYTYCVRTEGATSRSPVSEVMEVLTPSQPGPTPPVLNVAAYGTDVIIATWTVNSQESITEFDISASDGVTTLSGTALGANSRIFVFSNLLSGTAYDVVVTAKDTDSGLSAASLPATATTGVEPQLPPAPQNVSVVQVAGDADSVLLTWDDVSGSANDEESRFLILRATVANPTYAIVAEVPGVPGTNIGLSAPTYQDSLLSLGTQYFYKVAAYNPLVSGVNVSYSAQVDITTPSAPAAPTNHLSSVSYNLLTRSNDLVYAWTDNATTETAFKLYIANPDKLGICSTRLSGTLLATTGANVTSATISDRTLSKSGFIPTGSKVCTYVYAYRSDYGLTSARSNVETLSY